MSNLTNQVLDRLCERLQVRSAYALAKALGVSHTSVGNWRKGTTQMDDLVAMRAAELAGLDPATLLAELKAERAANPELRRVWQSAAAVLRKSAQMAVAACAIVAICITLMGTVKAPSDGVFA